MQTTMTPRNETGKAAKRPPARRKKKKEKKKKHVEGHIQATEAALPHYRALSESVRKGYLPCVYSIRTEDFPS